MGGLVSEITSPPPSTQVTAADAQLLFYVRPGHPQRSEFLKVVDWGRDQGLKIQVISAPGPTMLIDSDGNVVLRIKTAAELKSILRRYIKC
jgi:hypothetical protein